MNILFLQQKQVINWQLCFETILAKRERSRGMLRNHLRATATGNAPVEPGQCPPPSSRSQARYAATEQCLRRDVRAGDLYRILVSFLFLIGHLGTCHSGPEGNIVNSFMSYYI